MFEELPQWREMKVSNGYTRERMLEIDEYLAARKEEQEEKEARARDSASAQAMPSHPRSELNERSPQERVDRDDAGPAYDRAVCPEKNVWRQIKGQWRKVRECRAILEWSQQKHGMSQCYLCRGTIPWTAWRAECPDCRRTHNEDHRFFICAHCA